VNRHEQRVGTERRRWIWEVLGRRHAGESARA
jgi:hypothetical protein